MATQIYSESSQTYPNGIRRDFLFLSPAGYVPVLSGTVLWEKKDNAVAVPVWETIPGTDYTVEYAGGGTQATISPQVTLTLDDTVTAPASSVIFRVTVESQAVGASSCTIENLTNYTPDTYRCQYPQIGVYPGITDDVIIGIINEVSIYCNEHKFGKYYQTAMGLLVSHVLSMQIDSGFFTKEGSGIGLTLGLSTAGAMSSASAGSVSYSLSVDGGNGSSITEWLKGTGWGQRFLTMRNMVVAPVVGISRLNGWPIRL